MRSDFDSDLDGTCKWLMSGDPSPTGRFPEPPPPTCIECDAEIPVDMYDNPMPLMCGECSKEET